MKVSVLPVLLGLALSVAALPTKPIEPRCLSCLPGLLKKAQATEGPSVDDWHFRRSDTQSANVKQTRDLDDDDKEPEHDDDDDEHDIFKREWRPHYPNWDNIGKETKKAFKKEGQDLEDLWQGG